jgi:hypothetical protein
LPKRAEKEIRSRDMGDKVGAVEVAIIYRYTIARQASYLALIDGLYKSRIQLDRPGISFPRSEWLTYWPRRTESAVRSFHAQHHFIVMVARSRCPFRNQPRSEMWITFL